MSAKGMTITPAARTIDAIMEMRKLSPDIPAVDIAVLLYVGENPGCTQNKLTTLFELTPSHTTRILYRLSEWEKPGRPGLGPVSSEIDPTHRSYRVLSLTAKGRKVLAGLLDILNQ